VVSVAIDCVLENFVEEHSNVQSKYNQREEKGQPITGVKITMTLIISYYLKETNFESHSLSNPNKAIQKTQYKSAPHSTHSVTHIHTHTHTHTHKHTHTHTNRAVTTVFFKISAQLSLILLIICSSGSAHKHIMYYAFVVNSVPSCGFVIDGCTAGVCACAFVKMVGIT
jgi:hypothetical protein